MLINLGKYNEVDTYRIQLLPKQRLILTMLYTFAYLDISVNQFLNHKIPFTPLVILICGLCRKPLFQDIQIKPGCTPFEFWYHDDMRWQCIFYWIQKKITSCKECFLWDKSSGDFQKMMWCKCKLCKVTSKCNSECINVHDIMCW